MPIPTGRPAWEDFGNFKAFGPARGFDSRRWSRPSGGEWRVRGAAAPAKTARPHLPRPTPAGLAGDLPYAGAGSRRFLIGDRAPTVIQQE